MRYAIPGAVFILLIVVLAIGLNLDPRYIPSPLIDKPFPSFRLPNLHDDATVIMHSDMTEKPRLLNVWASWCVACRIEHPLLIELANSGKIDIVGLNYKNERGEALAWLTRHGDPYSQIIHDRTGKLGIDLGVYGVPETFVIDSAGIIRHKHVGPISQIVLDNVILPLVNQLTAQQ